ncbi:hypothetical protein U9M48_037956 [Paspalum notatum var. saurae]|uniref:Disease resistance protein RGA3 n=1 Tax=Paspalum notatum var. saurae TaxID=547442 RepID=A0AAQ3UG05_PASNO
MAETLLLPVVRGVVGKAADALVQRITRMCGVDDDRRKLERQLLHVQSLLADAGVKAETNGTVRVWMKALKTVAYQADDVLDNFQYEALRREALTQSGQSMASKVLSNFTSNNCLVLRYKASRDLKSVLQKIDELVAEMKRFDLVVRAEAPPQVLPWQTHSVLDMSMDIFGRDDDKEVVVKLLLDQEGQMDVQVLPIIGMGGVGKTTLAKMVFNDSRVLKHFELKMWLCVSENFEAISLVRSVTELATNRRCDMPDNIELLHRRLQEAIGRKRFLLMLDDVWNEDQNKWEEDLRPLLCSSIGGLGSMIVVTSRSRQVAEIMGTLPPHEVVCLSEDYSWELFSKKAFSKGVQEQAVLVRIGRRICNKCKGLPLALKAMGGLMSSKQKLQEWEAIAECNINDTNRGKEEVLPILKLSYKHLSPEMKRCFAFCAVFPKDYEMEKDKLIQLWISNGFILEEEIMDLTQKDGCGIDELKDLQLISPKLELYKLRNVRTGSKANLHQKRINELLLDWDHKRCDILTNDEVNHEAAVLESLVPPGELEFLEIHGYHGLAISQWMRDPQIFRCIRKLIISNCPRCEDLPIVWLSSSLEHVSLSGMDSLTTLCKNIDVDDAESISVQVFPRLKEMKLKDLPNLERWTESSAGEPHKSVMFPQLEKLEVMMETQTFPASSPWKENQTSLITTLNSTQTNILQSTPVHPKTQTKTTKQTNRTTDRCMWVRGEDAFISAFNLPKLRLGLGEGLAFLVELSIMDCWNIVNWPVEELRYLRCLRFLRICGCRKLVWISSEEILSLPLLENLVIDHCDILQDIQELPTSLRLLSIGDCPSLVSLPSNLRNLANLTFLSLSACGGIQAMPDGMDDLTSLEQLWIWSCKRIDKFPLGLLQRLPHLKKLSVHYCPSLQRRCREESDLIIVCFNVLSTEKSQPEGAAIGSVTTSSHVRCGGCDEKIY